MDHPADRAAELAQAITAVPRGHTDELREWLSTAFPDEIAPTATDIDRWHRGHLRRQVNRCADRRTPAATPTLVSVGVVHPPEWTS